MTGEVARAILTQDSRAKRYKVYTTRIAMPANPGVSAAFRNTIVFEQGRSFLWTGLAADIYVADNATTQRLFSLEIQELKNHRRFFRQMALVPTICARSLTQGQTNSTGEYVLFEGDESISISVTNRNTGAPITTTASVYTIALCGIEFIK